MQASNPAVNERNDTMNDSPERGLQKSPSQPNQLQRQQETFAPRNLPEAIEFAKLISDSGMVPKDYVGKPGAIVVAIQMGMEVGLQPMQALQSIAVINSRPAIYGDAALALVKTHSEFEWIKEDDLETITKMQKAVCVIKRRNQPEVKTTFSMEDAKKAGLQGKTGPWSTYPNRMLQMRARGFAIRDAFPDALKGIVTVEEAQDYEVIDGGPLVEQSKTPNTVTPDPSEQCVGMEDATTYYRAWKASGWSLEQAKEATMRIAGVSSSKDIKRKHYEEAMKWANSKPAPPEPAQQENLDAEPVAEGQ